MTDRTPPRRDSLAALLALALAAGCSGSTTSSSPRDDASATPDTSVGQMDAPGSDTAPADDTPIGVDAAPDAGALDVGTTADAPVSAEAGLDATAPGDVLAPADAPADVSSPPDMPTADVRVTCRRDTDCAAAPGRPSCELVSGLCVQCLPTSDACPVGSFCDISRRCVPGCRNGSDCVGAPGGGLCDTARRVCVGCLADPDCALGMLCVAGACVAGCNAAHGCATGQTCCSGMCVNTATSATSCGSCTRVCSTAHSTPTCMAGACVARCEAGFGDCDANRDNGCETSTSGNPAHCGACGVTCSLANASSTCANDRCAIVACSAGFQNCDNNVMTGCEAALATDVMNCGACGTVCARGQSCVAGMCQCPAGQGLCLGACTATLTDPLNCGMCNLACPAGQACTAGMCNSLRLYHGWTSPVPGCVTTSYNTTAPTNLGGRYPFNTGDSTACRAWKLAATVCTTQPLPYAGTTNFSCPQSGGFTDPVFGTYCAVANQFSCSGCPGACNAACAYNPLSLRNCAGQEASQP